MQRILDGTCVFPPDTDPEVVALLEEAALIRAEMDQLLTAEHGATVEEFITHWSSAREKPPPLILAATLATTSLRVTTLNFPRFMLRV